MKFKYYDILSQVIVGYLVLFASLYAFGVSYDAGYNIPYLVGACIVGYFVNTMGSILEGVYEWTIGGKPSNKLLRVNPNKNYTGIWKVKFYQTPKVIELLKTEMDAGADEDAMFKAAMRVANDKKDTRISDFDAHYAFSRTMLTAMIIITIVLIANYPCCWQVYLVLIPLLLSWERYKERGYYFGVEVLNVYLNSKINQIK